MAEKRYYLGSEGPFIYDDDELIGDPDSIFLPDAKYEALRTNGSIAVHKDVWVGEELLVTGNATLLTAPTLDDHAVRLQDIKALVPAGMIVMWSGASVPTGWLLCNGASGTPDLRNRFILGAGTNAIGVIGGNTLANMASKDLLEANLPSHRHTISSSGSHGGHVSVTSTSLDPGTATIEYVDGSAYSAGAHTHGGNTGYQGSGTGVDIAPPYYVLAFIMKDAY